MQDLSAMIGKPFKYGGRGPDTYDCFGLVIECYKKNDNPIIGGFESPPRDKRDEFVEELLEGKFSAVEQAPGTIVLMDLDGPHVGFVLDHGRFIHCSERIGSVCIDKLERYKQKIVGYYAQSQF